VFVVFKKILIRSNICKSFKITRTWLLNLATMECKMQSSMQFMETIVLTHEVIDFQIEELGECIGNLEPHVCHFNMWKLRDNALHLNKKA
jgi:hypothetical protein